jgi:hypothetical protein
VRKDEVAGIESSGILTWTVALNFRHPSSR